jgi:hypothetical protein
MYSEQEVKTGGGMGKNHARTRCKTHIDDESWMSKAGTESE